MSTEASKKQDDGSESLMGLFQPPPPSAENDKISSAKSSPKNKDTNNDEEQQILLPHTESDDLTAIQHQDDPDTSFGRESEASSVNKSSDLLDLFTPPTASTRLSVDESTPLMHDESSRTIITGNRLSGATTDQSFGREFKIDISTGAPQREKKRNDDKHDSNKWSKFMRALWAQLLMPTTYIGAFMFLLYHIVFSLTMGAAITRPHGGTPMLGIMSKMSASGVMFASIVYWWSLSDDVPALYPAVDLFCAPFLANLAAIVDDTLFHDDNVSSQDNDAIFLATFTFLTCLGLTITATLLMLSSVFKLANLGAFLPSPVLSGFFAAVGVLLWTLAVKVDTGGMSIGQVIFSGSWSTIKYALVHHVPSLVAACTMKYLSPKSPFYVVACIVGIIALVYLYMELAGLGLQDMVERGWFWSKDDLTNKKMDKAGIGFAAWAPPAPTGWIHSWIQGYVHWGAVNAGLSTAVALAFLYMIRCSLHGAALKKNISIMERRVFVKADAKNENGESPDNDANTKPPRASIRKVSIEPPEKIPAPVAFRARSVSEAVEIDPFMSFTVRPEKANKQTKWIATKSNPTKHTLTEILAQYAYSQYICAFVGAFAMTPSIGPSSTLYSLGAEALAPQVGSVILLSVFFLTEFHLVVYIPKPAFSSVLCLASIDMLDGWFIKSFQKTQNKVEWLVNPFIVIAAFSVGLLSAVFLGLALSTFFFVGSFYRSGVVKYAANGIMMRSTIERPPNMAQWLDDNGDYIQILVLQSYLFFGNATSVLKYVGTMFEEIDEEKFEYGASSFPPIPKVLLLDFSLVPGMDGSAVDVMSDLLSICSDHACRVFLSGMSPAIRKTLYLGGVKPDTSTVDHSQRKLRYFPDLDSAIGKAEDTLITIMYWPDESDHCGFHSANETGFQRCLTQIDAQHQTSLAEELAELGSYSRLVILEPGEVLYEDKVFVDRGLFFIEEGTLRIERSNDATSSMTRTRSINVFNQTDSIGQLRARGETVARQLAQWKHQKHYGMQSFRVARIGPGWVIGDSEALSGLESPGAVIAVDRCRLHYISFDKLKEIEKVNPRLILNLYKLLSKLHVLRSEVHIGQFATLHSIMSAPSHNRPLLTRATLAAGQYS